MFRITQDEHRARPLKIKKFKKENIINAPSQGNLIMDKKLSSVWRGRLPVLTFGAAKIAHSRSTVYQSLTDRYRICTIYGQILISPEGAIQVLFSGPF